MKNNNLKNYYYHKMSQKTVYKIGKTHQLFDLSNEALNFVCNFRILGTGPDKQFEYLVLSQEQLDQEGQLPPFNKATGVGVGRIIADKGQKQNYFLALKADEEMEVQVETIFQKLEDDFHIKKDEMMRQQMEQQQMEQQQMEREQMEQQQMEQQQMERASDNGDKKSLFSKIMTNKITWFILFICVMIAVYFIFFHNQGQDTDSLGNDLGTIDNNGSKSSKISKSPRIASKTPKSKLDVTALNSLK